MAEAASVRVALRLQEGDRVVPARHEAGGAAGAGGGGEDDAVRVRGESDAQIARERRVHLPGTDAVHRPGAVPTAANGERGGAGGRVGG